MNKFFLKIIVLSIFILISFSVQIFATHEIEIENTNIKIAASGLDKIEPNSWKPGELEKSTSFNEKVGKVLGAIKNFGITSSVLALMYIGIRSMMGSVEEKSEYKESLPTFIIGVFILLSCTTIPYVIYDFASKF